MITKAYERQKAAGTVPDASLRARIVEWGPETSNPFEKRVLVEVLEPVPDLGLREGATTWLDMSERCREGNRTLWDLRLGSSWHGGVVPRAEIGDVVSFEEVGHAFDDPSRLTASWFADPEPRPEAEVSLTP